MTTEEKLALLEETFEQEPGTLHAKDELNKFDWWDSMTRLSLIVLFSDEFGKNLKGEKIKTFVIIQDILNEME